MNWNLLASINFCLSIACVLKTHKFDQTTKKKQYDIYFRYHFQLKKEKKFFQITWSNFIKF